MIKYLSRKAIFSKLYWSVYLIVSNNSGISRIGIVLKLYQFFMILEKYEIFTGFKVSKGIHDIYIW